ncbi:hypothetical protein BIV57_19470 [Mangrovactinospora gilvigrisea]|uniref:Integral membrane protein n=1 Tax=Mangrovactinospora gilvigrisea TaxID=1428644 RepID=A0A1J7C2K8_9ACTN|nr:DMT family transporter [Mangrovactinospora gilvigrisea]OIV35804.1 hypothetical protein BIV57_19470 [Mangrovactinospora gilvigrisea]
MTATLAAVLLSLVSAAGYAVGAVVQERLAARNAVTPGRQAHALTRLLARGAWWWAVLLNGAGAALHVAALRFGPLTLVQPMGALTLVAAVPLSARSARRKVTSYEWRGTTLTLLGLAGLLLITGRVAPNGALSTPEAVAVAGGAAVLTVALVLPGRRGPVGRGLGARHATASGICSGIASALSQTVAVRLTDHGSTPAWQLALVATLVALCATAGMLLAQSAYRAGLGAPLALLTLANPAAAAVVGVALLGERFSGGWVGSLVALAAAVLGARGVVLLTREGGAGRNAETGLIG